LAEEGSKFRTLTSRLLSIYVPLVSVSLIVLFAVLEVSYYRTQRADLIAELKETMELESWSFAEAVWEYDFDAINARLKDIGNLLHVLSAVVYDASVEILGKVGDFEAPPEADDFRSEAPLIFKNENLSDPVGKLIITVHSDQIWRDVKVHIRVNALVMLVLLAALVGSTFFATRKVIGVPIGHLRHSIDRMKSENVREEVNWRSADELGQVVQAYNEMLRGQAEAEKKIQEYQDHLQELVDQRTRELSKTSEQLSLTLDSIPSGILRTDNDLAVVFNNDRYLELTRIAPDILHVGASISDVFHHLAAGGYFGAGDPAALATKGLADFTSSEARLFEVELPHGVVAEIRRVPTSDGGRMLLMNDITERKRAEEGLRTAHAVITDSIDYAGRIQRSILPLGAAMDEAFAEHFVIWEPRDVVGGDIYWLRDNPRGTLIVVADCTGHGVPGAFVTLIATGALDRALIERPLAEPGEILSIMNRLIKESLGQVGVEGESDDGLELGVCLVSPEMSEVTYAGARFSLWVADETGIEEIKGDKAAVGYRRTPMDQEFTNVRVLAEEGTRFYMSTDGLIDQVGGSKRRSFGKKRLIKTLEEARNVPLSEQNEVILERTREFQGDECRRDDITVVGFAIAT